ncbi:hypothetical protein F441_03094 [Phytophthora nicotianae CJ01A1]|uniref:Uncharacterized protein n=1 Tax=Phytophthora nicotianae CJ01A1 TaxID=1317063 RepID=W2XMY4_PHYNI|nr:hypothetical protein F441_03094 [Phytophthora nicotianae CJ01A1]
MLQAEIGTVMYSQWGEITAYTERSLRYWDVAPAFAFALALALAVAPAFALAAAPPPTPALPTPTPL